MTTFLKNNTFLAGIFVFMVFLQSLLPLFSSAQDVDKSKKPDGHFYIMAGWKTMKVPSSQMDFTYVDESPSPDSTFSSLTLNERCIAYNIAMGFDFNIKKYFFGKVNVDLFARQLYGFNVDLGGGLKFNACKFDIMPGIDFSLGANFVGLGKLSNSDSYIQVDNTKFAGKEVKISASEFFMGIKPGITIQYPVSKNIGLRMNGGYYFNFLNKPTINFSGEGEVVDEEVSANEKLDDKNISLMLNGDRSTALPYNYNGFFFNLGISVNIWNSKSSNKQENTYEEPKKKNDAYEYKKEKVKPRRKLEEKPKPQPEKPVLH